MLKYVSNNGCRYKWDVWYVRYLFFIQCTNDFEARTDIMACAVKWSEEKKGNEPVLEELKSNMDCM